MPPIVTDYRVEAGAFHGCGGGDVLVAGPTQFTPPCREVRAMLVSPAENKPNAESAKGLMIYSTQSFDQSSLWVAEAFPCSPPHWTLNLLSSAMDAVIR